MEIIKTKNTKIEKIIKKAVQYLKDGKIIIYPTETCYGIGADSTNQESVNRILDYKSKRQDKPLSIAVSDKKMATSYANFNEVTHNIFDNYLPGPITIVAKGKNKVAKGVQSVIDTVGIRLPDYPLILDIVKTFGKPITATSANVSYKKTPYCVDDILQNTSKKQQSLIGLIIDAGKLPSRKTNTVIDTTLEGINILREGDIKLKDSKTFISKSEEQTQKFAKEIMNSIRKFIGKKLIIFEMYGELGTGKTRFTRFFCSNLNVKENVVSPTFTLCNEYKGIYKKKEINIYHIDAYRMFDETEIDDLGSGIIFAKPNIVLIEWANKVTNYIKKFLKSEVLIKLSIKHIDFNSRKIEYSINY